MASSIAGGWDRRVRRESSGRCREPHGQRRGISWRGNRRRERDRRRPGPGDGLNGQDVVAGVTEVVGPRYDEAQHGSYLRRLDSAVQDPKNRNIALSGRYGTGKSSVLDKFEENHKDSTLRLAISTLAPDAEGASLTNRIQKELVKQLVYSASSRTLRHSRFSRNSPISPARAFGESVAFVGVLVGLLALLGRLPSLAGTDAGHPGLVRTAMWVLFTALLVVVVAVVRMVT